MSGLIALGLLVTLLIFALGRGINSYHRLSAERLQVDSRWSQVDTVLQQCSDLIPELLGIVKGYGIPEEKLLDSVARSEARYRRAGTPERAAQAAEGLSCAMGQFFAMAEAYPELKADRSFRHLRETYFSLETGAAEPRRCYNEAVLRYNRLLLSFPASLLARIFRMEKRSCIGIRPGDRRL